MYKIFVKIESIFQKAKFFYKRCSSYIACVKMEKVIIQYDGIHIKTDTYGKSDLPN